MSLRRPVLALVGSLALLAAASGQQPAPPPGSPGATTSIDGKQLPPPDPPFGGVIRDNALTLAAEWHAEDMINNRNINDNVGSDGSSPQDRANAAGFHGKAAETVAINPAMAISSLELVNQWYYNPDDMAIIRDCANTAIGVWSDNSLDRTVVVAVYGQTNPRNR